MPRVGAWRRQEGAAPMSTRGSWVAIALSACRTPQSSIGGQARMSLVHTLAPLGVDDRFVTSSIPVDSQTAGDASRTTYSASPSRLNVDLHSPSRRRATAMGAAQRRAGTSPVRPHGPRAGGHPRAHAARRGDRSAGRAGRGVRPAGRQPAGPPGLLRPTSGTSVCGRPPSRLPSPTVWSG